MLVLFATLCFIGDFCYTLFYSSLLEEKISDEKQKIDHIKQLYKEVLTYNEYVNVYINRSTIFVINKLHCMCAL